MRFFFPDAHELVDPTYDFNRRHGARRDAGQQTGSYAHEIISPPPYDGLLVSRAIIQGKGSDASGQFRDAKYSFSEQQRLFRNGAREFFRVGEWPLQFMGDCGAFSYRQEKVPPFTVDGVIQFYTLCDVDLGVSVDHVILGYDPDLDRCLPGMGEVPEDWRNRQEITVELAAEFFQRCASSGVRFQPVGVAQGWSPLSYARSVAQLQDIGYRRIGMGGMVPLKTHEVITCLEAVACIRHPETQLHLFGLTRCDHLTEFQRLGVTSFDSTSPLTQAFKDDRDNYYTPDRTYTAVRVRIADPKVNRDLIRMLANGQIEQEEVLRLEDATLKALAAYDEGHKDPDHALAALMRYEMLFDPKTKNAARYRETLVNRPWKDCPCQICRDAGIHVLMFRGSERNRRRGFHNLFVTHNNVRRVCGQVLENKQDCNQAGVA